MRSLLMNPYPAETSSGCSPPRPARGVSADARRVMSAAACLEGDAARVVAWYVGDPIASLGNHTAECLVHEGQGMLVVRFLRGVASMEGCVSRMAGGDVVEMVCHRGVRLPLSRGERLQGLCLPGHRRWCR
jgi:hypothetical protein